LETTAPRGGRFYVSANQRVLDMCAAGGLLAFRPQTMAAQQLPDCPVVVVEEEHEGPIWRMLRERGFRDLLWVYDHPDLTFVSLLVPVDAFHRDTSSLENLPDEPDFPTFSSGVPALDPCLKWRLPELVIMAGPYGQGKSLLGQFLGTRFIAEHGAALGCQALFCSFEDMTSQIRHDVTRHAAACNVDPAWLRSRIRAVVRPSKMARSLEWFSDLVYNHVEKHGVKYVLLDPWNEVDHERDMRQSETDYVREAMRHFRGVVDELKIIMVITTHVSAAMINSDGTVKQFRIAQSFGCYSDDTEVLTVNGWKKHADLTQWDEVGCFDPAASELKWHMPSAIHRHEYDGEMHRYKGYGVDLLVTPNHRMLVKPVWKEPVGTQKLTGIGRPTRFPKDVWSFETSERLPRSPFRIPRAAKPLAGGDTPALIWGYPADSLMNFLGWYIAEGSGNRETSGVTLAQATASSAALMGSMDECGITFAETKCGPGGKGGTKPISQFYVHKRGQEALIARLRAMCGTLSRNMRIPEFVFTLSVDLKRKLLDAYLLGDGHRTRNSWSATTTSPGLADDLQRLSVELGMATTMSIRTPEKQNHLPQYLVSFGAAGRTETIIDIGRQRSANRIIEHYAGPVWCLTVPTGAYFVRRNGAVAVCGNSVQFANKADRGMCVARTRAYGGDHMILAMDKVKIERLMGRRDVCALSYDWDRHAMRYDVQASNRLREDWKL
jgi:archaellum biogenesis ATPase FlaH